MILFFSLPRLNRGQVKPVVTVAADSGDKEAPHPEPAKRRRVFFGNTSFYVFFRLYQTLHERVAKVCLSVASSPHQYAAVVLSRPQALELTRNPPKDGYSPPPSKEKNPPPEKKDKYQYFQKLLYAMINGQIDQTRFEDEVHAYYAL